MKKVIYIIIGPFVYMAGSIVGFIKGFIKGIKYYLKEIKK